MSNSAVFKPTSKSDGEIYFCSAGNISTSGTKYRTIGYKLSVKNTSGNVIQTVYYQMPGKYMKLKYQTKSNGKEYLMYSISLNVMRKRLSTQTLNALSSGSCTIILDACMVLRVNGKNKGGMNDNGPSWGKVYTTYAGISKAANWTDSHKVFHHLTQIEAHSRFYAEANVHRYVCVGSGHKDTPPLHQHQTAGQLLSDYL